ncbi:MAG: hypothetical protein WC718_01220 [Phycisphaerales bacterium]
MRDDPREADEEFPDPHWLEPALAALLIELSENDPTLVERVRARVADAAAKAEVSRIRGPSATPAIKRTLAQGLRWLGGVSLFNEAAWGPLAGRLKKKRRK